MRMLIFGNTFRVEALWPTLRLVDFLQEKKVDLWIEQSFFDFLKSIILIYLLIFNHLKQFPNRQILHFPLAEMERF